MPGSNLGFQMNPVSKNSKKKWCFYVKVVKWSYFMFVCDWVWGNGEDVVTGGDEMGRFLFDLFDGMIFLHERSDHFLWPKWNFKYITWKNLLFTCLIDHDTSSEDILEPLSFNAFYFLWVVWIFVKNDVNSWSIFSVVFHGSSIDVLLLNKMRCLGLIYVILFWFSDPAVYDFGRLVFEPFLNYIGKYSFFVVLCIFH